MITLQEAAARWSRSPSTLRHQIRRGKLRARKVGVPGRDVWMIDDREAARYERENLGNHDSGRWSGRRARKRVRS